MNVSVQTYISQLRKKQQKRTQVTADRVVRELARVAFFDIRKVATWDTEGVEFIPSNEIDSNSVRAIQAVKSKRKTFTSELGEHTTVDIELKMCDKLRALDKLAMHLGMYSDTAPKDGESMDPPNIIIEPDE